jgi:hypothetical protein
MKPTKAVYFATLFILFFALAATAQIQEFKASGEILNMMRLISTWALR